MLKCEIIGNIGADAEIKDVQGNKFVSFRVAHSSKFKDAQGNDREETTWVDVTLNNVESKVIPFLKQGVKVFVRGNASLRVYSSPKLKQMLAGLRISATEIELCGGTSDEVPRQIIDPSNGQIFDVSKHYWCNHPLEGMKQDECLELIDKGGRSYLMNAAGFVVPAPVVDGDAPSEQVEQAKEEPKTKETKSKSKSK